MRLGYPVGGGSGRSLRLCLGRIVGGGKGDGKGKGSGVEEAWESCYRYFEGCYEESKLFFFFFLFSFCFLLSEVFFLHIHRFYILLMSTNVLARPAVLFFWSICSVFGEGPSNLDGEPLSQRFLHICTYVDKRPAFAESMHTQLVWRLLRHQIRDEGGSVFPFC